MRRALIVGINDYGANSLSGCVDDAAAISKLLSKHYNRSENFACEVITASCENNNSDDENTGQKTFKVTKAMLRKELGKLFRNDDYIDIALFYFAGHGTFSNTDGYLVTQDFVEGDEGFPMSELVKMTEKATNIREIVIILDCCYSGNLAGGSLTDTAELRKGVSILTSSQANQTSAEARDGGLFTKRICAALDGAAANIVGNVNIALIYEFVNPLFGATEQRPMFKANLSKLTTIRKCDPAVPIDILQKISEYFHEPNFEFFLDPSYEPDLPPENKRHEKIFSHLQKYRAAGLLKPVGEEHLFFATKNKKSCVLTPLGKYYWELASKGRL